MERPRPGRTTCSHHSRARGGTLQAARKRRVLYLTVTVAPAPSRAARALSAASLATFSRTGFGAPSTRSLASFRPSEVSSRTTLMTWIFLSPAPVRMTSNSSFSSTASAGAPGAPGAATATAAAAAVTSNFSSNAFTNSESWMRVMFSNSASSSSWVRATMAFLPLIRLVPDVHVWRAYVRPATTVASGGTPQAAVISRAELLGTALLVLLGAQRVHGADELRRKRLEDLSSLRLLTLQGARQLGEQNLAGLEVRELLD